MTHFPGYPTAAAGGDDALMSALTCLRDRGAGAVEVRSFLDRVGAYYETRGGSVSQMLEFRSVAEKFVLDGAPLDEAAAARRRRLDLLS